MTRPSTMRAGVLETRRGVGTFVRDGEGRVAARIIGQLPDDSVLKTLVRDALEES